MTMGTKCVIAIILASLPLLSQAQTQEFAGWTMKGEQAQLALEEGVLKVPDTIAAVDLRGVSTVTLDCSSAIPNCLYYIDGEASVEGLPNANVVCDGVCDGLLLTDAYGFYCPVAFTATDAMLRLTPRRDDGGETTAPGKPCYETVFLPFDADLVIASDVDGPMPDGWLQAAVYDGHYGKMLYFSHTNSNCLHAQTPYLVSFSTAVYGTPILFCGQDKAVEPSKAIGAVVDTFDFVGVTAPVEEDSTYFRYHRGQTPCFIHTGDGQAMEPFRCFVVAEDVDAVPIGSTEGPEDGQILEYEVGAAPAGIVPVRSCRPSKRGYDLQGRRINLHSSTSNLQPSTVRKGVYILDGNKTLK